MKEVGKYISRLYTNQGLYEVAILTYMMTNIRNLYQLIQE